MFPLALTEDDVKKLDAALFAFAEKAVGDHPLVVAGLEYVRSAVEAKGIPALLDFLKAEGIAA